MIGCKSMKVTRYQLLLILLVLILSPGGSNGLVKREERQREEDSAPRCRTLTGSALKSSQDQRPHIHNIASSGTDRSSVRRMSPALGENSFRMRDQPAILDRLDLPQTNITHVLEEQKAVLTRSHQIGSAGLWLAMLSSAVILLASTTLPVIEMNFVSAIAFVPWIWSSHHIKQRMGLLLVELMVTMQLFSKSSVWAHVQAKILPWLGKTVEKMIYMELWRQAWTLAGKAVLNEVFQQRPATFESLPLRLQSAVRYVDGFFRRGTEKIFKKNAEKVIEKGVGVAIDFVAAQQSLFTRS